MLNGCSRGALGALLERAGDAPGRPRALLGRPGMPREGPGTDFLSIFDAPETEIASDLIELLQLPSKYHVVPHAAAPRSSI